MFKTWVSKLDKRVFYMLAVLSITAASLLFVAKLSPTVAQVKAGDKGTVSPAAPSAVFPADAPSLGAIPDGPTGCGGYATATPKDVTFTVSGISGTINDVRVSTTFSPAHTWRGDLSLELRAPGGSPSKILYRNTGSTTAAGCGSSSDAAGPYNFYDTAPLTDWNTVATTPTPAGDYQAVTPCGVVGCGTPTPITPTFTGLTPAQINGMWTLRILDGGGGDTGTISAASLTITTAAPTNFDTNMDVNGDGKTDWVVGRATATPLTEGQSVAEMPLNKGVYTIRERMAKDREDRLRGAESENALAPPIAWYSSINGTGTTSVLSFGDAATDFFVPNDYDGDGKTDVAVWRPGAPFTAAFYILRSTDNTIRTDIFGQTDDDPAITGDYDGDGKADTATFRCPAFGAPAGQCFFYYRPSNPVVTPAGIWVVPWGFGNDGDFFVNPGDFDGDGKNDFCIQRANPASTTTGQFVLLRSSDFGAEYINWGSSSDFILPGDYDGDGKSDFCVRRTISGARQHFILERDGGGTGPLSPIPWGITGDVSAPGDYDGDGKQDLAVWRSNADPTQNFFYVRRSSDSAVVAFEWGQQADVPPASWYVH